MATTDSSEWLTVGRISGAYGIRGWIRIEPYGSAEALLHARYWRLVRDGQERQVERAEAKFHSGSVVAQLVEVPDRNASELLKGYEVAVARADFPKPATDEHYWVDLIGCDVFDTAGERRGVVRDMMEHGAHAILEVQCEPDVEGSSAKPKLELVPFVGVYVKQVDTAARRIVLDWGWE
jgi:16S rRNA processing protein RimM